MFAITWCLYNDPQNYEVNECYLFSILSYLTHTHFIPSGQSSNSWNRTLILLPVSHKSHQCTQDNHSISFCTWNAAAIVCLSFTHCVDTRSSALAPVKQSDGKRTFLLCKNNLELFQGMSVLGEPLVSYSLTTKPPTQGNEC